MTFRIAVPAYLNCRAYFHHPLPEGIELLPRVPSDCVRAMAAGEIDAGIIPVGGLAQLGEQVSELGEYGIASDGPVGSVLCFSNLPLARLDNRSLLQLTSESATSVRLLALLLRYQHSQANMPHLPDPRLRNAPVDAELLIGDSALRQRGRHPYLYEIDLAEAWRLTTGLPFVFARWAIRRNAPAQLCRSLHQWLSSFVVSRAALDWQVSLQEAAGYGLGADAAFDYLQGMKTALGITELAGQHRFEHDLALYQPEITPWCDEEPRRAYA